MSVVDGDTLKLKKQRIVLKAWMPQSSNRFSDLTSGSGTAAKMQKLPYAN
jgi:hypothetical protein